MPQNLVLSMVRFWVVQPLDDLPHPNWIRHQGRSLPVSRGEMLPNMDVEPNRGGFQPPKMDGENNRKAY